MLTRRTLCPATPPPATSGTARRTTWTPRTRRWWMSPTTGAPSPSSPPGEGWDSHQVIILIFATAGTTSVSRWTVCSSAMTRAPAASPCCCAMSGAAARAAPPSPGAEILSTLSTMHLSTILISSICHIIYLSTVLISNIVTSSAVADGTDPTSATGVTYFEKICISKLNIFSKYQMWTNLDSFSSFSISYSTVPFSSRYTDSKDFTQL